MKSSRKNSFSTRLTIYILSVCTVIFLVIFIILYVLPRISQYKNVTMYSELIAEQAENQIKEQGRVIERINSMLKLEPIKDLLIAGDRNTFKSILKNTPEICGCALEYEPGYKNHDVLFTAIRIPFISRNCHMVVSIFPQNVWTKTPMLKENLIGATTITVFPISSNGFSPVSSRCMIRKINLWGIYDWIFS